MKKRLITTITVLMMIIGLVGINTNSINAEDTTDYLCFTAEEAGSTIKLTKTGTPAVVSLETSTDKVNWTPHIIGDVITLINVGDKVYFRNTSPDTTGFSISNSAYYKFVMSGKIAASGDVTTLINKNGTETLTTNYVFNSLFDGCSSLIQVSDSLLPAMTLTDYCYVGMFRHCSFTSAPELPAMIAKKCCYQAMFTGCESLKTAPELPAETLGLSCYQYLFQNCTGLKTAPELPAMELEDYCYSDMFKGCNSLSTIPELPATILKSGCYYEMFNGCTNIKISNEQNDEYTIPIIIPSSGSITMRADSDLIKMFYNAGGPTSFTTSGTPTDSDSDGIITLYLKPYPVTITYDGNGNDGGTVPTDSGPYVYGNNVTIKDNENLLTKTGYAFIAWNTKADGTGTTYQPTDTLNITKDTVLYAIWGTYSFNAGTNQEYTDGSMTDLTFTCDGPKDHLSSVQVDNVEIIENDDYTAVSGSTIVTLKSSYLETLGAGNHTLKLVYDNGQEPTVTFSIVNSSAPEPGPTPNNNNNTFIVPNTGIR